MNRTVLEGGNIVIAQTDPQRWEISTVSLQFLDWIRESFGDWEDEEWSLIYYSGSMSLIVVHDERIIATTMLRWL
jgi:hypothetical protein